MLEIHQSVGRNADLVQIFHNLAFAIYNDPRALTNGAANKFFGYYITNFATLKNIYGAYVFLIVGIFWIYYPSAIFIIAAEIGQLFRERRANRQPGALS